MPRISLRAWASEMGIGEGPLGTLLSRRSAYPDFIGASLTADLNDRVSAEPGRSASPYLGSENGNASDDSKSVKGKGKAKPARKG